MCTRICHSTDRSQYKVQEEVTLWANKIGPYHNPQETYSFYSIPFCQPNMGKELKHKWDGLGSILEGNELVDSGLHINFKGTNALSGAFPPGSD